MGAVVRRATIESIVAQRNQTLTLYGKAHAAMEAAREARIEAAKAGALGSQGLSRFNAHSHSDRKNFLGIVEVPELKDFMSAARRLTDTDVWSHLITITDLDRLMDKKAKDEFTQQLIQDPPEVTVDNVAATLEQFLADACTIWKRGIAECFSKLDRRFRSHDGWKIGSRVIITRVFTADGYWNYHGNDRDTLHDIERVFKVIEDRESAGLATGSEDTKPYLGIVAAVEVARRGGWGARQTEVDSDFFKVRAFKNGNAHVWFKRDNLVDKVNQLLGEFYGNPIPEERAPDDDDSGLHAPKTTLAKNYGFYPTPSDAAARLLEAARLYRHKDELPLEILEPSAGTGNLARLLVNEGAVVDCVEVHADRAAELHRFGNYRRVITCDFLKVQPNTLYDRVVMNPPFDRERDIDHVMHALKFLKPAGRLVAIMSAGTEFRETRKSQAFRELMASMNADWRDLPAGSFASVGTYCNTLILSVRKDGTRSYR